MAVLAAVELRPDDRVPVLRLGGEVGIANARAFREKLTEVVENRDLGVVIDLSHVTYLDSAGVNVLFEVAEALRSRQLRMALVVPERGLVRRVVELVDLVSVAGVHRSVEAAVAGVREARGTP
jgi:anti-anti-sigma factor